MQPELVHFGFDERDHLVQQIAFIDFTAPTEIDQLSIETVARRAPAILVDQSPWITAKGNVLRAQLVKLHDDRLHEGCERDCVVDTRLSIANSEFNRVEEGMKPNVPPNLFGVVDATGRDQQL